MTPLEYGTQVHLEIERNLSQHAWSNRLLGFAVGVAVTTVFWFGLVYNFN